MQKVITGVLAVLVAGLAATLVVVIQEPATSTIEIDKDRASISNELSAAQSEAEKYSGGAIKALLDARVETLRHTLTMLDQKRTSILRRIALTYSIESHPISPAPNAILSALLEEIKSAESRIASAQADADRYSGGLVHSLKLMTLATEELSVAQLRMKFYTAKYSLPLPVLSPTSTNNQRVIPPGKVVSDKEAL